MKYLYSNKDDDVYEFDYEGIPIRFCKNRITKEVTVNADDVAKVLGFNNIQDMMMSSQDLMNAFLDAMNKGFIRKVEGA